MSKIGVLWDFYNASEWIRARLSFHKIHPGVIFSHWPQHGINNHILSIPSYYPMNSTPLRHGQTHAHTHTRSCQAVLVSLGGTQETGEVGGQWCSPLSCWEQTSILLHERWKWTGDEHAECSDKRWKKNGEWTYYCCRSEAVSKGVKEGALCNKPNKEVIDSSTGSTLLAVKKRQGTLVWQIHSRLWLQSTVFKAQSRMVLWTMCSVG